MDLRIKIDDPKLNEALCKVSEKHDIPVEQLSLDAIKFMFTDVGDLFAMMNHYKRMIALAKEKIQP